MKFSKEEEIIFQNFFLLKERKKYKQALKVLEFLPSKHKNRSLVNGLYGTIFYLSKDFKSSALYFSKVIAAKPKSELASLGLFQSLVFLGQHRKALKELFRYTEISTPKLYLITIGELMEDKNIEGIGFKTDKKMIQNLYKKWCLPISS